MKQPTLEHNEKIARLTFASVFPHYIAKIERKGRNIEDLYQVIEWLTGYNQKAVSEAIEKKISFKEFFENAILTPNAVLIKGTICGYKVQEIENKLTREVRYLDLLVDEIARGKTLEKICRA